MAKAFGKCRPCILIRKKSRVQCFCECICACIQVCESIRVPLYQRGGGRAVNGRKAFSKINSHRMMKMKKIVACGLVSSISGRDLSYQRQIVTLKMTSKNGNASLLLIGYFSRYL